MLTVNNIRFNYGRRMVLDGLSFDAAVGEIIGVVGANGTGKTTLLRILATVLPPESGTVSFNGLDSYVDRDAMRRQLGFLPERCPLYDSMTVREYLRYRGQLKGERFLRLRRNLKEVMSAFGLEPVSEKTIGNLSAGYRKRIGLADAVLGVPKLLLLDDPFSGLDPETQRIMGGFLSNLSTRSAVIVSGHSLGVMAEFCNRFIVLREDSPAELLDAVGEEPKKLVVKLRTLLTTKEIV